MRSTPILLVAALAACATLWPKKSVETTTAPLDVLMCAAAHGQDLRYKINYLDSARLRLTLRKPSRAPTSAEADALRNTDQIELWLAPTPSGGTRATVRAGTIFAEETKRGPTDSDVPASPGVRADADTILARCATPASASS